MTWCDDPTKETAAMTKRLVLVMVLVALLVLGGTMPSFAQTDVPAFGPFAFTLDRGFAQYTFAYAGDGSEIAVELGFAPGDAIAQRGVALKLYGPDGAVVETGAAEFGMVTLTASPAAEGSYTVEAANYHENLPMQFSLVLRGEGISDVAAVEAAAEPEAEADEAEAEAPEAEEVPVDDAAGAQEPVAEEEEPQGPEAGVFGPFPFTLGRGFANATFGCAGDVVIDLSYAPGDALAESGVGLKLYGPDGAEAATGAKSFGVATIEATCIDGTYTVEIANYHENLPIQFSLVIRGDGVSDVSAVELAEPVEVAEVEVVDSAEPEADAE
jgi:hypothetical protein